MHTPRTRATLFHRTLRQRIRHDETATTNPPRRIRHDESGNDEIGNDEIGNDETGHESFQ